MNIEHLIKDNDLSDAAYDCYHPSIPIQIFNYFFDEDERENCEINIARHCDLKDLMPYLNQYLEWLGHCEKELSSYFQEKAAQALPEDWFRTIEVYSCSITFNSAKEFGATVTCGESLYCGHILEFDFELYQITGERLSG